jgi:N4-gp56 family major capsid protein
MLSRATLPQEFFDITSDMLLIQPEPQYLHGQLLKMALGASLDGDATLGISPGRAIGGDGAPYGTVDVDRFMLADPLASEAIVVIPELGKTPGHTIKINRPVFANTTYTQASRLVGQGVSISTTPIDVTSEQAAITLQRFAGPYDQTNSRVAPLAADKLDAQLPVHKAAAILGKQLKRDFDRTIDAFGVALFDLPTTTVRPAGFAADTDSIVAGDAPMDFDTLTRVESTLDAANIPQFSNGRRICVLHPRQIQQLKGDSAFQRLASYDRSDVNPLFKSWVAKIGNLDIFQSSTLTQVASTVTIYRGQCFGPGMVGVGAGNLPHTAYSTADNYGEQALVVWLWYAGFTNLDQRFGVRIHTS